MSTPSRFRKLIAASALSVLAAAAGFASPASAGITASYTAGASGTATANACTEQVTLANRPIMYDGSSCLGWRVKSITVSGKMYTSTTSKTTAKWSKSIGTTSTSGLSGTYLYTWSSVPVPATTVCGFITTTAVYFKASNPTVMLTENLVNTIAAKSC